MVSLQRFDREFLFLERTDAMQGGKGGSEGGDHRYAVQNCFAADAILITPRDEAERGIDDQLNLAVLDQVGDIGSASLMLRITVSVLIPFSLKTVRFLRSSKKKNQVPADPWRFPGPEVYRSP